MAKTRSIKKTTPSPSADSDAPVASTAFGTSLAAKFKYSESATMKAISPSRIQKPKSRSTSRSKPKIQRQTSNSSKYAPPSKYAHLSTLPDSISPNLLVLLVGHNPGVQTAVLGHAYAHPSNRFWPLLHLSGLTPDRQVHFSEDRSLPEKYSLGLTNIVSRPTRETAELTLQEQALGTPVLEEKVKKYRPEVVCCVGKSIWEAVWRYRYGRGIKKEEFKYGWQNESENMGKIPGQWGGARMFVATSTSGLAAGMKTEQKVEIWKELGDWVQERRKERKDEENIDEHVTNS